MENIIRLRRSYGTPDERAQNFQQQQQIFQNRTDENMQAIHVSWSSSSSSFILLPKPIILGPNATTRIGFLFIYSFYQLY
jgi:hypothetical protein